MAKAKKKKAFGKPKKKPILSKILANKKEFAKAKENMYRSGEKLFGQATREVFRKFPELHEFGWKQYTPGWNDGDPCRFGCYFESLIINGEETEGVHQLEQTMELLSGDLESKRAELKNKLNSAKGWEAENFRSKLKSLDLNLAEVGKKYLVKKTLVDLLEAFDESVLERMFGEGFVVVTREGAVTNSCEHD